MVSLYFKMRIINNPNTQHSIPVNRSSSVGRKHSSPLSAVQEPPNEQEGGEFENDLNHVSELAEHEDEVAASKSHRDSTDSSDVINVPESLKHSIETLSQVKEYYISTKKSRVEELQKVKDRIDEARRELAIYKENNEKLASQAESEENQFFTELVALFLLRNSSRSLNEVYANTMCELVNNESSSEGINKTEGQIPEDPAKGSLDKEQQDKGKLTISIGGMKQNLSAFFDSMISNPESDVSSKELAEKIKKAHQL
jgi:hypothetical protein